MLSAPRSVTQVNAFLSLLEPSLLNDQPITRRTERPVKFVFLFLIEV